MRRDKSARCCTEDGGNHVYMSTFPSAAKQTTLAEESCESEPLSELASKVINFFTTADGPAKFGLITYDCAKLECFIGEVLRICNKQFLRKIQNRPHWGLLRRSHSASKVSIF